MSTAAPRTDALLYASLGRRLAAFTLDYLVLAAYMTALTAAVFALGLNGTGFARRAWAEPWSAQLLGSAFLTLPVLLYFALTEASPRQATLGKRGLGLRVAATAGGRLPLPRSLLRSALKLLPWELAHTILWRIPGWPGAVETVPPAAIVGLVVVWLLVAAYVLGPLMTHARQTPYDRAAGAVVIRGHGG